MHIGHVTSSISRIGAGVAKVVRDLSEAQSVNDNSISIFTLLDEFTHADQPDNRRISVHACPVVFSPRFGYAPEMGKVLKHNSGTLDVLHLHGLWMYPNRAAGVVSRTSNIPYIMSPHGMLDSRSLGINQWKKKLSGNLFEYSNIEHACCLHACSEMEAEHIRCFGFKGPIAVVSTGLTTIELTVSGTKIASINSFLFQQFPQFVGKKIVLFLSRLHEQKGIAFLLDTWIAIANKFPDWHLVIAGDGNTEYVESLKRRVHTAGLSDSVTFTGGVHGDNKWALIQQASLFVLPTLSENFGLVVAEALACGVPVITTKGTPWRDLETEQCGWWIDTGTAALKTCIDIALSLPANALVDMGQHGRKLVKQRYLIDKTALTLQTVYEWMITGDVRPECVRLD